MESGISHELAKRIAETVLEQNCEEPCIEVELNNTNSAIAVAEQLSILGCVVQVDFSKGRLNVNTTTISADAAFIA